MKVTLREVLGFVNVPSDVGARAWEKCFVGMANRSTAFGINETFLKSAKELYLRLAKARGFKQYGMQQGPNPFFWNEKHWKFVAGAHFEHHGRGANYDDFPGFNDARYMTIVVLQGLDGKGNPAGPQQCFLFTHWAAFGGNAKVSTAWVQKMHRLCIEQTNYFIDMGLDKGMIVWFMGDTNIGGEINLPQLRWIKPLGIDKIGVAVPKSVKIEKKDFALIPLPTDHDDGIVADVLFELLGYGKKD